MGPAVSRSWAVGPFFCAHRKICIGWHVHRARRAILGTNRRYQHDMETEQVLA